MDALSSEQDPYFEAWDFIQNHPGTGGSNRIAKLVLSLWNDDCAFAFSECCTSLDTARKQLALRLVAAYLADGETPDLVRVGHLIHQRYPEFWELGQAATAGKQALRDRWERERLAEAEAEELRHS